MTTIDYSTVVGKLRMRVGDISDLPYLPDSVYTAVYAEEDSNLARAAQSCAKMILVQLSFNTHRRMSVQLEVWGAESYRNYRDFLLLTVTNPAFMSIAPIPYSGSGTDAHPLIQFASDWNKNFPQGTQSQQLAFDASISPNDGSLYGPIGGNSTGLQILP